MTGMGGGIAPPATATPAPAAAPRRGRSFGARLKLFGIFLVALPFALLAVTELAHQLQRGHLFLPFTYHWDLETREVDVRGNQLREVRPRLTNYTPIPFRVERLEGDGLLWFRETRYRHRVENRPTPSAPWRVLHREDLVYERQGRPPRSRIIGPWETLTIAWHPVHDAVGGDAGVVLHRGEEVRFVLYTLMDGEENSPHQKVLRSPAFKL